MSNIIAYKGEVSLEKATWDNIWGMYAEFKLEQPPQDRLNANPFKKFTKMKKGKVGTRFGAVFTFADESTGYEDEVMLKGWSDGTTGCKVTLWLNANDDGLHPFMDDDKGQLYAVAMVELQDDNTVVDQVKREKLERKPRGKQTLSNYAAMLCRTSEFWLYIRNEIGLAEMQSDTEYPPPDAEKIAADWIRNFCGIASRAGLDNYPAAAETFHEQIRKPYARWVVDSNMSTEHT